MDTSLTIKSRAPTAPSGAVRPSAVRTDLAPSQSVNAVNPAEAARQSAALAEAVGRDAHIDPQNRNALYRELDERRRNSRRAPDEALARMRAYGRAALPNEPEADGDPHADLAV
jgi:hypothetical protein